MKIVLILLFFFAGNAAARNGADSLETRPFEFPENWLREKLPQIHPSQPRIESNGVVIGNTKYFMKMYRPDSSVDYKILKVTPNLKGMEKMPGTFLAPPDIRRWRR